ncbi:unnamed protein product [Discula destructiva]
MIPHDDTYSITSGIPKVWEQLRNLEHSLCLYLHQGYDQHNQLFSDAEKDRQTYINTATGQLLILNRRLDGEIAALAAPGHLLSAKSPYHSFRYKQDICSLRGKINVRAQQVILAANKEYLQRGRTVLRQVQTLLDNPSEDAKRVLHEEASAIEKIKGDLERIADIVEAQEAGLQPTIENKIHGFSGFEWDAWDGGWNSKFQDKSSSVEESTSEDSNKTTSDEDNQMTPTESN